jgi:hypothetical protein
MATVTTALSPCGRGTFGLAGRTLAINADDDAVSHILDTTYANARVRTPRSVDHTATMNRLTDGRLHVRFDRRTLSIGDAGAAVPMLSAYYAAKEVFARFAAGQPGSIAFYGALVEIHGTAILILGPTTIGKTLFALHLAWQGAKFLGDETAVLDLRTVTIGALARKPALREPALVFLPAELRARIKAAVHVVHTDLGRMWYALSAEDLAGIAPCDHSYRLGAVCVIRERAHAFGLRRIELADALPALMQRAYARPSRLAELSGLRRAMRGVPQYEIALSDPLDSASRFLAQVPACA